MSPRRGQRHSHLYVHGSADFSNRLLVNHFFERMPGSMGSATWSALAACVLIWLAAAAKVWADPASPPSPVGGTDIVAVLLAFPVVIALWAGVDRPQSLLGDVLIARVTKSFTILISIAAAYTYVLGPLEWTTLLTQWLFIAGLATVNLLACASSWFLRARVHDYFIRLDGR